jgi:hypothetical protein
MKTLKNLLLVVLVSGSLLAEAAVGEIHGRVIEKEGQDGIPFVTVVAMVNGQVVSGTLTDIDGYYSIKPLKQGTYDVKSMLLSFQTSEVKKVTVSESKMTIVNIVMVPMNNTLPEVILYEYQHPLIDPAQISTMRVIETEDIEHSPYTSPQQIATLVPGVSDSDESGELNVRGSRSEGTQYIVDGIRITGPFSLPKGAIREMTVLTGGVPAMYGDATGGIIIINTKSYIGR